MVVIRSCSSPRSVASVGWYPTAEGIRPSSADTSELACRQVGSRSSNGGDTLVGLAPMDRAEGVATQQKIRTSASGYMHRRSSRPGRSEAVLGANYIPARAAIQTMKSQGRSIQADQATHIVTGGAHLCEAEDVVHKQQHILALSVTEVLCHSQTCRAQVGRGGCHAVSKYLAKQAEERALLPISAQPNLDPSAVCLPASWELILPLARFHSDCRQEAREETEGRGPPTHNLPTQSNREGCR